MGVRKIYVLKEESDDAMKDFKTSLLKEERAVQIGIWESTKIRLFHSKTSKMYFITDQQDPENEFFVTQPQPSQNGQTHTQIIQSDPNFEEIILKLNQ